LSSVIFSAGNRVSVFCKAGTTGTGGDPDDVGLVLYYNFSGNALGEGGAQNGAGGDGDPID